MAGIYIHIPFCKSKCSYCDFYSVANKQRIPDFVDALLLEFEKKKSIFDGKKVETIYFGGGTPSILEIYQIEMILSSLSRSFNIITYPEITLEANPDDLSENYLKELIKTGVNRLSIGIQSLDKDILRFLRRKHSAETAIKSIENAVTSGFDNISVDLIYGIPGLSDEKWKSNLINLLEQPVQHLSAYHLGVEENTLLHKQLQNKKFELVDEDTSFKQYSDLVDISSKMGFPQYEISNFARIGKQSRHNSAYWKGIEYMGLGPSAHSYYSQTRSYNTSNLADYIENIKLGQEISESENLNPQDLLNEAIMLSMRTVNGLNLIDFEKEFGSKSLKTILSKLNSIDTTHYSIQDSHLRLTKSGMFISDSLICELFE